MVWYKDSKHLHQENTAAYDVAYLPGQMPPHSGIYRCDSCGVEIVAEHGRAFPATHAGAGPGHVFHWRLVARSGP